MSQPESECPHDAPGYWAYVIEYDADWITDKGKGTVYVGYTGNTPEGRLAVHRAGGLHAAAVFKKAARHRGANLRLRCDLASAHPSHHGPWPTAEEAMKHERSWPTDSRPTVTSSRWGSVSPSSTSSRSLRGSASQ